MVNMAYNDNHRAAGNKFLLLILMNVYEALFIVMTISRSTCSQTQGPQSGGIVVYNV